jgi:hypothetical protein
MTLPTLDWAHAAFEAARRRDIDAELGALAPLIHDGRPALDAAMRAWMDRTLIVMTCVMHQRGRKIGRQLEMRRGTTGELTPIDEVPDESAWAARMFMAYAHGDRAMWEALWSVVPEDWDDITVHVMALLHAMTATAESYAQQSRPDLACCPRHTDPMLHATRAAMAHYN